MSAAAQTEAPGTARTVSRAEWEEAMQAHLAKEKKVMRLQDELAAEQRRLPRVEVTKDYAFDAADGKVTLADLFAGKSQLFIKHFMLSPGQTTQCVGCSLEADHVGGLIEHLAANDISYTVVARAPLAEIEALKKRMGWTFPWVSSFHSDFGYDFGVSFRPEDVEAGRAVMRGGVMRGGMTVPPGMLDMSGNDVFQKDEAGRIFHTYTVSGRGGENFLGIYRYIDATPKGRQEPHYGSLADWARPRTLYGEGGTVEANGRYHKGGCGCAVHG